MPTKRISTLLGALIAKILENCLIPLQSEVKEALRRSGRQKSEKSLSSVLSLY
ncbi:hypothetical protein [Nitrosomonas ureae]|uniref:hypothetical protein n=1 Tax=Nitrosomonas ureae TaxID=44577 RepID=UPI000ABCFBB7|nr:hypothetical protein [Nitrosomonas ureae]